MNASTFLNMPVDKKEKLLKKVIRAANKEQRDLVKDCTKKKP